MGYEIDYIPVGEGERSGDAICLRYGNLLASSVDQVVMTIDGGTIESGEAVVEHIRKYYSTDVVDIALLSHPDADHASGMRRILEETEVKRVVMHRPWLHCTAVKELLDDSRITSGSVREKSKKNLAAAYEIEQLATSKGIPIFEPFAGSQNKIGLFVLGPTKEFYEEQLCSFKFMPSVEAKAAIPSLYELLKAAGKDIINWVAEAWIWKHSASLTMMRQAPKTTLR